MISARSYARDATSFKGCNFHVCRTIDMNFISIDLLEKSLHIRLRLFLIRWLKPEILEKKYNLLLRMIFDLKTDAIVLFLNLSFSFFDHRTAYFFLVYKPLFIIVATLKSNNATVRETRACTAASAETASAAFKVCYSTITRKVVDIRKKTL